RPALEHVMGLFRELRVILLLGKTAQDAWSAAGIRSNAVVLTAPHPSPLSIRTSAERRRKLWDALVQAKRLAQDAPARPTIRERETPSSSSQGGVSRVVTVEPAAAVVGAAGVPGNKGSSQRAVLLGAVADGESRIRGFGRAADTLSAVEAARALGAEVTDNGDDDIRVRGAGLRGLRSATIDCGNAGTVLRLLCGLLVGQEGASFELVGDESLTMRPHERAAAPLRQMGAHIETTDGHAP